MNESVNQLKTQIDDLKNKTLVRTFKKEGNKITDTVKIKPANLSIGGSDGVGGFVDSYNQLQISTQAEYAEMKKSSNLAEMFDKNPNLVKQAVSSDDGMYNPMYPHWKRLVSFYGKPNVIPTWNVSEQKYYIGYAKETGVYVQPYDSKLPQMLVSKGSIMRNLRVYAPVGLANGKVFYDTRYYDVPRFLTEAQFKDILNNKPSYEALCNVYELMNSKAPEDNTTLNKNTEQVVW